jgi:hypothetical protein
VAAALFWGLPCPLPAQVPSPTASDAISAYRIPPEEEGSVRVDGTLSEGFWARAPALMGLRQREPREAEPPTERTEVRIAYDDATLYVGITAFDSEPDRVVARILQRDRLMEPGFPEGGLSFAGDDAVAILLDPFHDHRSGMVFATNANGAEFDALLSDEGSEVNIDWRAVWEVGATRTERGWSAEMAIPWRTLRYPDASPDRPWGINVFRIIRRKNEQVLWQAWEREGGGLHRVSRAGHLLGLEDLPRRSLNLEAKPFLLARGSREPDEDTDVLGSSGEMEGGLDLKAELRPGLVLDLTYNTDFAQVEVDDEQVNLTRFDLFFPEKRDFFLENSGILEFGVPGNPFEPPPFLLFFSRRIGIDEDEGEVPILGGARLTGRVGGQTVGLLSLATEGAYGLPSEYFNVARVKRDVAESGYVGAMVADRRSSDAWNTAAGIDGQIAMGRAWIADGFYARTATRGPGGDDHAYRVGLNYTGDEWGLLFNHLSVGEEAEAESGFIVRTDVRGTDLYGRRRWRPTLLGLRKLDVWSGGTLVTTMEGRMQDWQAGVALNPEWEAGDDFFLLFNAGETVLDEAFELSDTVDIPIGRYRADNVAWFGGTSPSRWVHLMSTGTVSRFYGGTLFSLGGTLTASPSSRVSLALGYTRNDIDVPNGAFTAHLSSVRASYAFSTRLFTNALVQYNSLANTFSANLRLNLIHRPGSDLFVVLTEERGDEDVGLWDLRDRGVVAKITYLARF